jgi:hypothetical protein
VGDHHPPAATREDVAVAPRLEEADARLRLVLPELRTRPATGDRRIVVNRRAKTVQMLAELRALRDMFACRDVEEVAWEELEP